VKHDNLSARGGFKVNGHDARAIRRDESLGLGREMDFIQEVSALKKSAAKETARLRPAVNRLWWGVSALAVIVLTGVVASLLTLREIVREQYSAHLSLQQAIDRLIVDRQADESILIVRFRSGIFPSGISACEKSSGACDSWSQQGPNEGPTTDFDSLLSLAKSPLTVVIVEGAHDSQELSKKLRASMRDNQRVAMARAESVQSWLEKKTLKSQRPSLYVFPVTRPTTQFEYPVPIDRTVWVTVIALTHEKAS
jgi:hypothetical protein